MIGKNNPFNIRHSSGNYWKGQTGYKDGFCVFSRLEYGVRAAAIIVMRSYRARGVLTFSEIINTWAPSSENPTSSYIKFVCGKLSALPFDIPHRSEFPKLLHAMSCFEGDPVSVEFIEAVLEEFDIVPYKCR